ncbi:MAG: response regulator transcription factor [Crocinitomicaceae bacterium]
MKSEKVNKILVADDHPIFRTGMMATLKQSFTDWDFTEAHDGTVAKNLISKKDIEIAILDIDMPGLNGIQILKWMNQQNNLSTKAIVLTMHNDEHIFNEAFDQGVQAYLVKDNSIEEIVFAINQVLAGNTYVSPMLQQHMQNRTDYKRKSKNLHEAITQLTQTEIKTLKLVAQNKSSKEVADLLFVTKKTVENYRSRICKKLDLSGESNALLKWTNENKDLIDKL